ncbi:hypothetical protein L596_019176 [Steinernema carpocapsae]|uniref:Tudor domain-containing protein n=1 Tax=Steinernema carpocapsae TaxID=34508 RepID=A0A4U5N6X7_STECR|nr:hypothetical protein L596_019176 [Steinernema carpocapsae]
MTTISPSANEIFERNCSEGSERKRETLVDTSDEMEEIREILYEMCRTEFTSGVCARYLENTYSKRYSSVSLGPSLPSNWLQQIEHSEEFKLLRRGHLILVLRYAPHNTYFATISTLRASLTQFFLAEKVVYLKRFCKTVCCHEIICVARPSALKRFVHPPTRSSGVHRRHRNRDTASIQSEHHFFTCEIHGRLDPSLQGDIYSVFERFFVILFQLYKASVGAFGTPVVCTFGWASDDFSKFSISPHEFHDILHGVWNVKVAMKKHFSDGSIDEASAEMIPQPQNLYAVKEKDFWYRVEVQNIVGTDFAMVYFIDRGTIARVEQKEILPLNSKFTDATKYPAFYLPAMLSMSAKLGSKFVDACRRAIANSEGAKCEVQFVRFDDAPRRFLVELNEESLVVDDNGNRPDSVASKLSDSDKINDRKNSNGSLSSAPSRPSSANGYPIPKFEPLVAKEMTTGKPFPVYILHVTDPDNISVRPCSLDPIPEYMYKSLSRDWEALSPISESEVVIGGVYIAKVDSRYERVRVTRQKSVDSWTVFTIDVGSYETVHASDLKALTTAGSFMKVMMIKCRLDGIMPNSPDEKWPESTQAVLLDLMKTAKTVQLSPVSEWTKWRHEDAVIPIMQTGCRVEVDGVDVAKLLIKSGLALQR